jgi:bifunctional UDP-N-acetylglucosamine pyrophosphorylase/glucosamine-1-phosphate N-acetyltransferase
VFKIKAVILAAGKGERLRPLTQRTPKCMLPIANRPILEYVVNSVKKAGIKDIAIIVGYKKEEIVNYFKNGERFGIKIEYLEQEKRLGTAHAIGLTTLREDFLVLNGDALVEPEDIKRVVKAHNSAATLGLIRMSDAKDYGVVKIAGEVVKDIIEKPKKVVSDMVNAGIYAFSPKIFEAIKKTPKSERGEYEITTSIKLLIKGGEVVKGVEIKGRWLDIGSPWNYLDANKEILKDLKSDIKGTVENHVTIKGRVVLGKGSVIKSGSYIEGPVCIGENSSIGPNAYLRNFATIGDSCHIGYGVEIKNSIVMDNTKIPHLSYVGDSIIGKNCNLGAGVLVGNLRLDNKNVRMRIKGELVDSKRRKLGCVIGDNSKLGLNVMINSGRKVGCNCKIGPGVIIYSNIPDNSFIVQKQGLVKK